MKEYFPEIGAIQYEGAKSTNPLAFKFYDLERVVLGRPMKEHLPFAMAWWHNLGANGTDMFGRGGGGQVLRLSVGHHGARQGQGGRGL